MRAADGSTSLFIAKYMLLDNIDRISVSVRYKIYGFVCFGEFFYVGQDKLRQYFLHIVTNNHIYSVVIKILCAFRFFKAWFQGMNAG